MCSRMESHLPEPQALGPWRWHWARRKPGALQSLGAQRIGHHLVTEQQQEAWGRRPQARTCPSPGLFSTLHDGHTCWLLGAWLQFVVSGPRFDPWIGKIPWRRKWQPIPVLLLGESHGGRSLVGYSPWGRKESDRTKRLCFHFHALEGYLTFLSFIFSPHKINRCFSMAFLLPLTLTASDITPPTGWSLNTNNFHH